MLRINMEDDEDDNDFVSEFLTKFTPLKLLGQGTFGCVFEAEKNLMGRVKWRRAVKRIPLLGREEDVKKAIKEVEAMLLFNHHGIVKIYDSWQEKPPIGWQRWTDEKIMTDLNSDQYLGHYKDNCTFLYIQMELCQSTLAEWLLDDLDRNFVRSKNWFRQIVSAVQYIHSKGLIHRDLKPSNILLASEDVLKVCDLGIVADRGMMVESAQEIGLDRTCNQGTPMYMAPEQGWGEYTSKVDIFALGLILTEMCLVMTENERAQVFQAFRSGKNNHAFENDPCLKNFISSMTDSNDIDRPDCEQILKHYIFNREVTFESEYQKNFETQGILGMGGFGIVFDARNIADNINYAVKRIAVKECYSENDLKNIEKYNNLDHEGIVKYINYWIERPPEEWQRLTDLNSLSRFGLKQPFQEYPSDCTFIYIQMEKFDQSLSKYLEVNGPLSLAQAKNWFRQIVSAVAYLHSTNIHHGDLKPNNLLITDTDIIKICDVRHFAESFSEEKVEMKFRIKGLDPEEPEEPKRPTTATSLYMPPEKEGLYNHAGIWWLVEGVVRGDSFSLGLIFAELCVAMPGRIKYEVFDDLREDRVHCALSEYPELADFVTFMTVSESIGMRTRVSPSKILDHPFLS